MKYLGGSIIFMPKIDPDSSVVYIALSILCSFQNSLVPEILYLMSPKQIIDFIKVFGGETIKVPPAEEFSRELLAGLACYHIFVEEKSWDWFALKYNLGGNSIRNIQSKLETWIQGLTKAELAFIDSLKTHDKAQKAHEEIQI